MWPFTPKSLYDRYSKLMKLIISIDSHFEVTENKEDSVRLHLPNYKGNQPMDFHIYILEPFLFIAFTTEIEGEKISTVQSYPQDMDQQDIFNAAMASNLERIHQCLAEKSKNDEENDEIIVKKKDTSSKDSNDEKATYGIVKTWPLLDFARAHGKMQVGEFANKETGEVFKSCIFTKPDGTRTFVAFAAKMGELTPQQIAAMKNELQVVQLESGNYSLCKIGNKSWANVDLSIANSNYIESLSTEVSEENLANAWTDGYGVKYSWDKKRLLKAPGDLKEYTILNGTGVICDSAFEDCKSISTITIPLSVERIGNGAFFGCNRLSSIYVPANVKEIGESVLTECRNLTSIVVDENNWYYDSRDNCNAIIETKSGTIIAGCSSTIIPDGIKVLGRQSYGGSGIKSVVIPDGVFEIGPSAFCACEELQSVEISGSVEAIGQLAFCGCKSLTTITIPDGIKEIGDSVFMGCVSKRV